jgi:DNA-binding CsgD family transcriptional regulator/PAS domain-containing protein
MSPQTVDIGQFSDVVGMIYDCAVDPHLWPKAIEKVGQLVDGINGVVMIIDTVENKSRFYVDWNVDPMLMRTYSEKFHADNPLNNAFTKFDVDEPYNISMVMKSSEWLETRVYREFGQPNGWLDSIGVTLLKTPSRFATLSIARHHDVGFAGPREIEIMRLLAPHLRKATSIADLIEMRELTSATFESAFDALLVPVVFVDSECRIIHANGAARELFAAGDLIRSERGVLKAQAPDATQRLEAATRQIGRGGDEAGQVVYIPFADGRPAFGHVLPTRSGTVRGRIEPRATAAIFITPAATAPGLPLLPWASAFGLTAAEVRVLELLVEGSTIDDVAAKLNVAATTARTHRARLMQKTGTTRQVDLVRMAMQLLSPVHKSNS